jgi:KAP family P-loop domain
MGAGPDHSRARWTGAPLTMDADDRFDRRAFARRIARDALAVSTDSGVVLGLCGPWGSGKTTVANFVLNAVEELDENAITIRFNPWIFSGADDLVGQFFAELAIALRQRDLTDEVAGALSRYAGRISTAAGGAATLAKLVPGLGALEVVAELMKSAAESEANGQTSIEQQRRELSEELRKLAKPIVVLIDDVDRLTDDEVHTVMRLVKLVGDLAGVTYLLAFDRQRVEEVLGASAPDDTLRRARGRAYLEKIVQARYDVPQPRSRELLTLFDEALATDANDPLKDSPPGDRLVLRDGIRALLRTPRDIVRVVKAMPTALELHGEEVANIDLVGLEALRILEPDVHALLPSSERALFSRGASAFLFASDEVDQERRQVVDGLLSVAGNPEAVRLVLAALFPGAQPALGGTPRATQEFRLEQRAQRIAVAPVFRRYFHGTLDANSLSGREIKSLGTAISEPDKLGPALGALDPARLLDALARIPGFEDELNPGSALSNAQALLDCADRLPGDYARVGAGFFGGTATLRYALLAVILAEPEERTRSELVRELYDGAPNLSMKLLIANWLGTSDEGDESGIVDTDTSFSLRNQLRSAVLDAEPAALADEPERLLLMQGAIYSTEGINVAAKAKLLEKMTDNGLLLKLLADMCVKHRGGEPVRSWWVLNYEAVNSLIGRELMEQRIGGLESFASTALVGSRQYEALRQAHAYTRGEPEGALDRS